MSCAGWRHTGFAEDLFWQADPQASFCRSYANRKLLYLSYERKPVLSRYLFGPAGGWLRTTDTRLSLSAAGPSAASFSSFFWFSPWWILPGLSDAHFNLDAGFDSMQHSCSMIVHTLVDKESDVFTFSTDRRNDRHNDLGGIIERIIL